MPERTCMLHYECAVDISKTLWLRRTRKEEATRLGCVSINEKVEDANLKWAEEGRQAGRTEKKA